MLVLYMLSMSLLNPWTVRAQSASGISVQTDAEVCGNDGRIKVTIEDASVSGPFTYTILNTVPSPVPTGPWQTTEKTYEFVGLGEGTYKITVENSDQSFKQDATVVIAGLDHLTMPTLRTQNEEVTIGETIDLSSFITNYTSLSPGQLQSYKWHDHKDSLLGPLSDQPTIEFTADAPFTSATSDLLTKVYILKFCDQHAQVALQALNSYPTTRISADTSEIQEGTKAKITVDVGRPVTEKVPLSLPIHFSGTAKPGEDFALDFGSKAASWTYVQGSDFGIFTLEPKEQKVVFTIEAKHDNLLESQEAIVISIVNPRDKTDQFGNTVPRVELQIVDQTCSDRIEAGKKIHIQSLSGNKIPQGDPLMLRAVLPDGVIAGEDIAITLGFPDSEELIATSSQQQFIIEQGAAQSSDLMLATKDTKLLLQGKRVSFTGSSSFSCGIPIEGGSVFLDDRAENKNINILAGVTDKALKLKIHLPKDVKTSEQIVLGLVLQALDPNTIMPNELQGVKEITIPAGANSSSFLEWTMSDTSLTLLRSEGFKVTGGIWNGYPLETSVEEIDTMSVSSRKDITFSGNGFSGEITVTVYGGKSPFTYAIYRIYQGKETALREPIVSMERTHTFDKLFSGDYKIVVKDMYDTAEELKSEGHINLFIPEIKVSEAVCQGESINLAIHNIADAPRKTYTWYDAETGGKVVAKGTEDTDYLPVMVNEDKWTSYYLDYYNGAERISITTNSKKRPEFELSNSIILARSATINLREQLQGQLPNALTYQYYRDSVKKEAINPETVPPGRYYVQGTDASNGCSSIMHMVEVRPAPVIRLKVQTPCEKGGMSVLTAKIDSPINGQLEWIQHKGAERGTVEHLRADTNTATYFYTPEKSGIYSVRIAKVDHNIISTDIASNLVSVYDWKTKFGQPNLFKSNLACIEGPVVNITDYIIGYGQDDYTYELFVDLNKQPINVQDAQSINKSGTYGIRAKNSCGDYLSLATISVLLKPRLTLRTGACVSTDMPIDLSQLILEPRYDEYDYQFFNGSEQPLDEETYRSVKMAGQYQVEAISKIDKNCRSKEQVKIEPCKEVEQFDSDEEEEKGTARSEVEQFDSDDEGEEGTASKVSNSEDAHSGAVSYSEGSDSKDTHLERVPYSEAPSPAAPILADPESKAPKVEPFLCISPNSDGKNDALVLEFLDQFPHNSVSIFSQSYGEVYRVDKYHLKGPFKGYGNVGSFKGKLLSTYEKYLCVVTINHQGKNLLYRSILTIKR